MDQPKPYVITIVGPESSGKTTLARELAARYGCPWVPEFAREYLEGLGRDYDQEDLTKISEGQLTSIHQQMTSKIPLLTARIPDIDHVVTNLTVLPKPSALQEHMASLSGNILGFYREYFGNEPRPMVIVDGGMLTLRLWARIKFGISIPIVEEALSSDLTSLYLLCRPVWPWEPDPLREAPSILDRAWIYNQYLKELVRIQST
jgi:nicotinamide riboside kinase